MPFAFEKRQVHQKADLTVGSRLCLVFMPIT